MWMESQDDEFDYDEFLTEDEEAWFAAAYDGDLDMLMSLEDDVDIDVVDKYGETALMIAVCQDDATCTSWLIEAGADLEMMNNYGRNALMMAALKGHPRCVELLLEAQADIEATGKYGMNALLSATARIYEGSTESARVLINARADVNVKNFLGNTPLISAVFYKHNTTAKYLLAAKADIEAGEHGCGTALSFAVSGGNGVGVKILLDAKANIHAKDRRGITPLIEAIRSAEDVECLRMLIDAKANVNDKDKEGTPALILAAKKDNPMFMKLLIDAKAKLDAADEDVMTALDWAVEEGRRDLQRLLRNGNLTSTQTAAIEHHDVARLSIDAQGNRPAMTSLPIPPAFNTPARTIQELIAKKSSLECVDTNGNTPLLLATKHSFLSDVSLLLSNKANVEARNNHETNALMLAAMNVSGRNGPLMDRLINVKAGVDRKNKQGRTPLLVAAYHSNLATVKKLLSAKANINKTDEHGNTALSLAARHGAVSIVKTLLSAKANVKAKDKQGKTALYWALQFGDESCVKVLRAAGAKE